tara:strand:+ start:649 stop:1170 length:522 start_codon:yes stop_codon:yes gene_type:complete
MKTTEYRGITQIYFQKILSTIIKLGNLKNTQKTILDFGCGHGTLSKLLPNKNIIGYDIVPEWSDVSEWETVPFDIFISNQTFCLIENHKVEELLRKIRELNPRTQLIVGMSKRSILNNIGKYIFNYKEAHSGYKLEPNEEISVIKKYCKILKKKSVFYLADVYVCEFHENIRN